MPASRTWIGAGEATYFGDATPRDAALQAVRCRSRFKCASRLARSASRAARTVLCSSLACLACAFCSESSEEKLLFISSALDFRVASLFVAATDAVCAAFLSACAWRFAACISVLSVPTCACAAAILPLVVSSSRRECCRVLSKFIVYRCMRAISLRWSSISCFCARYSVGSGPITVAFLLLKVLSAWLVVLLLLLPLLLVKAHTKVATRRRWWHERRVEVVARMPYAEFSAPAVVVAAAAAAAAAAADAAAAAKSTDAISNHACATSRRARPTSLRPFLLLM